MTINDLKPGDIITYSNNKTHYVNENKTFKYLKFYNKDMTNKTNKELDIIEVKRYISFFGLYRLKTIFRR